MRFDPLEPLSVKRISEILQKNEGTILKYIKAGKLRAIPHKAGWKSPLKYFVLRQDLECFLYSTTGFANAIPKRKAVSTPVTQ
jgi:hypothetical protein